MARARQYEASLTEDLADPQEAAAYLTACIDEGRDVFLLGLRDVAKARGGMSKLAEQTELTRKTLYDLMSEDGNPTFDTISAVLDALGVHVQFVAAAS